jgi:hypothetical protein
MSLPTDLKKLLRRNGRERRELLEAFVWLGILHAASRLLPFRQLIRQLGLERGREEEEGVPTADPRIAEIGWAISAAAAHVPWHSTCLVQAFCGVRMLGRRGIPSTLQLGVAKGELGQDLIHAHAWLSSSGQTVIGRRERWRFNLLAVFHRRPTPPRTNR